MTSAARFARTAWRAIPGDLLGRLVVRLAGARVTRRVVVDGIGRVDLAEDPRLGRWLDRVSRTPTAMTFGNVVIARRRLDDALVRHEAEHVRQWSVLGPLFLPAYLAASAAARGRGDDRYRAGGGGVRRGDRAAGRPDGQRVRYGPFIRVAPRVTSAPSPRRGAPPRADGDAA
jgi:hypothetical protein